jgi:SRSO17 transposase
MAWVTDPVRRATAPIPTAIGFQTKAEIAIDLTDWAIAQSVTFAAVVADADDGDQPFFLDQLDRRALPHVGCLRCRWIPSGHWGNRRYAP